MSRHRRKRVRRRRISTRKRMARIDAAFAKLERLERVLDWVKQERL